MKHIQRILVSLIIYNDLGILLLQRGRPFAEFLSNDASAQIGVGLWELPGGGLEFGETPLKAAVREASEETGILLDERTLKLTDCCAYRLQASQCDSQRVHLIYETRLDVIPSVRCSDEHVAFKWMDVAVADLHSIPMIVEIRDILSKKL